MRRMSATFLAHLHNRLDRQSSCRVAWFAPSGTHQRSEFCMFTKDLSANVPLYGQEQCFWCGAASAQMTRDGYPNPSQCLFVTQLDLWNIIQAHNSSSPADVGWAT